MTGSVAGSVLGVAIVCTLPFNILKDVPVAFLRPGVLLHGKATVMVWFSQLNLVTLLVVAIDVEAGARHALTSDPVHDTAFAFLGVDTQRKLDGQHKIVRVETYARF